MAPVVVVAGHTTMHTVVRSTRPDMTLQALTEMGLTGPDITQMDTTRVAMIYRGEKFILSLNMPIIRFFFF